MNDVFDIFNSRVRSDSTKPYSCGYGVAIDKQLERLHTFHEEIQSCRFGSRRSLLPFQHGFAINIVSLKGLHRDISSKTKAKYILTPRLNQDCLESFFSKLRGIGHYYDHPVASEVRNRMRLLLIGANPAAVSVSPSCLVNECDATSTTMLSQNVFTGVADFKKLLEAVEDEAYLAICGGDQDKGQELLPVQTVETLDVLSVQPEETPLSVSPDCPSQAYQYLVEYIAFRLRKYDRSFCTPSQQHPEIPVVLQSVPWIYKISRGGFLVPSNDWLDTKKPFEPVFASMHPLQKYTAVLFFKKLQLFPPPIL